MNRPVPPGDRGARGSASRWPRGRSRAVPGSVGLVGGVEEDSAVGRPGPEGATEAVPGRLGPNAGHLWRGGRLVFLLLLLARSGGCGLVLNPRSIDTLSAAAGHDRYGIYQKVPENAHLAGSSRTKQHRQSTGGAKPSVGFALDLTSRTVVLKTLIEGALC
jgi:hypothetical protein